MISRNSCKQMQVQLTSLFSIHIVRSQILLLLYVWWDVLYYVQSGCSDFREIDR